jgi:cytohesin
MSLMLLTVVVLLGARPVDAAESPVAKAARLDDLATVQRLIREGADVNVPATDGSPALLWAAYQSNSELAQALLAAGADANAANNYGVTPLLQASRTGDAAMIGILLGAGADPELAHPDGQTPLMAASAAGRVDAVGLLLERGANPNATDSFQAQTALMWAAAEGHSEVVGALLAAGADPNSQARINALTERKNADFPSGGFTAVMWATRNGHEAVVGQLVEGGADLKLTNGDGATATIVAIVNDRYDLAATLVDLGADPDDGSLYHAVEMRDATTDWYARDGSRLRADHPNERTALDLISLLLDKGADPNKPFVGQMHNASMCCDSSANATPFYRAAVAADVEALKLLIAHGADLEWAPEKGAGGGPGANANVGRTPVMAAMNGGRGVPLSAGPGYTREGPPPFREPSNREPADALRLLLAAGANPDAVMPNGATALHQAVQAGKLEIIRVLAEGGATLDKPNGDGLTALYLAENPLPERTPSPFGPGRDGDRASPEEVAALLRELMQAAGVPVESVASAAE